MPLDKIRLNQIGLDAETDNEEIFKRLSDTLCQILQYLTLKMPDQLNKKLYE